MGYGQEYGREGLVTLLAALLAAAPAADRRSVAMAAIKKSALEEQVPIPMIWNAIPDQASLSTAISEIRGLFAYALALAQAINTPGRSVGDLLEDAQSIMTGVATGDSPIGGDPVDPRPSLAAVMVNAAAQAGGQLEPEVAEGLLYVIDKYDCYEHVLPLGGSLGSIVKKVGNFFKAAFGSDDAKARAAASNAQIAQEKATAAQADADQAQLNALLKAGVPYEEAVARVYGNKRAIPAAPSAASAAGEDAGKIIKQAAASASLSDEDRKKLDSVASMVQDLSSRSMVGADRLKEQLGQFAEALKNAQAQAESEKEKSDRASRELARLAWAQQILDAPDEVVARLREVAPQWSSVQGALQTALDLLASAKEAGDLGSARLVSKLVKALRGSDPVKGDWIASLLSGDATQFLEIVDNPEDHAVADAVAAYLREQAAANAVGSPQEGGEL